MASPFEKKSLRDDNSKNIQHNIMKFGVNDENFQSPFGIQSLCHDNSKNMQQTSMKFSVNDGRYSQSSCINFGVNRIRNEKVIKNYLIFVATISFPFLSPSSPPPSTSSLNANPVAKYRTIIQFINDRFAKIQRCLYTISLLFITRFLLKLGFFKKGQFFSKIERFFQNYPFFPKLSVFSKISRFFRKQPFFPKLAVFQPSGSTNNNNLQ